MKFLNNKINTLEDIKEYIRNLVSNDMLYNFDDDAEDIMHTVDNVSVALFTEEQCKLVNERRDEMLDLDYDYAFGYVSFYLHKLTNK
jgi:hypothetical protein